MLDLDVSIFTDAFALAVDGLELFPHDEDDDAVAFTELLLPHDEEDGLEPNTLELPPVKDLAEEWLEPNEDDLPYEDELKEDDLPKLLL